MNEITDEQKQIAQKLRESTGRGLMECKRVLSLYDYDKAKEYMQNPDNFRHILDWNRGSPK